MKPFFLDEASNLILTIRPSLNTNVLCKFIICDPIFEKGHVQYLQLDMYIDC